MNYYYLLGIRKDDDKDTLHKIRNILILKYHPDKGDDYRDRYNEINKAYEEIIKNLTVKKTQPLKVSRVIRVILPINIKDLYFKKNLFIAYSRRVFCPVCNGTGSSNKNVDQYVCDYCKGKGLFNNFVYQTFFENNKCVKCNGTGIKKEYLCTTCHGNRYIKEIKTISFTLNNIDYLNKMKKFEKQGDQIDISNYGDVIVFFRIKGDDSIIVEKEGFVVTKEVYPSQIILGDEEKICLFNNRFISYQIKKGFLDSVVIDKIDNNIENIIKIKHIIKYPKLIKETEELYKKILEIEKNEIV
jgi:DnaJ-class molecular chaperone